ncbi:MFS polyamine transporter [Mycena sp. CBHHK59/15]|nr:MFS polyamine transporter [Mycena sp. CBHHK59/15]
MSADLMRDTDTARPMHTSSQKDLEMQLDIPKKWGATIIVALFTFISPVTSTIIAPPSHAVAAQFGVTDNVVIALFTSIFVLAYGPMSELYGSNLWFIIWNVACSLAQNASQLLIFRFLAGLGGSASPAIGGSVIGDMWAPEERGRPMALYSLMPLLGPVIGPTCGAWIAQLSTWRWVFWATTIAMAVVQICSLFLLRESYAPFLLDQKAMRVQQSLSSDLKKEIIEVRSKLTAEKRTQVILRRVLLTALTRPFHLLFAEPIVQLLGLYMAFVYGTLYLFLVSMTLMFERTYRESVGIAGLNYLALGLGVTVASYLSAHVMDRVFRYCKERNGGIAEPEFRLLGMVPGTLLLPIGLFLTGWSAQYSVHWIVPSIGIALVGAGTLLNFQSITIYIIDTFTLYAASAMSVVSFLRSIAGFCFPLFAPAMYDKLGYGKGDTVLAVVAIAAGCPAPWLLWKHGKAIRMASKYARREAGN